MSSTVSQVLTTADIEHLVDAKLLQSVDGINSAISNSLTIYVAIFAFFAFFAGLNLMQRERVKKDVLAEVNRDFDNLRKEIETQVSERSARYLRHTIGSFEERMHEEEFYRNVLFKDLNEILASEIHQNGNDNLKDVFNLHAERMYIVTQLTSGKREETIKALKKLSTGTYDTITRQLSFRRYIDILTKKEDTDLLIALETFKQKWIVPQA